MVRRMKPLYIRGPVAWFGIDNGLFRVEREEGVLFLSETKLPVPLLVEHDPRLEIGQVLNLQVENERLVATCVIDESQFMSVVRGMQQCDCRYQSLDIGNFLKVLLPSFSSYHKTGSFAIREISLVDVGRREGGLWSVHSGPEAESHITKQRLKITLVHALIKLLYLVFRQRQNNTNRKQHLCRDAKLCGLSTEFVSASSLSPLPSIKPPGSMANSSDVVFRNELKRLLKKHAPDDSENEDGRYSSENNIGNAPKEPTYTHNEVVEMVFGLAKKQTHDDEIKRAAKARLQTAIEKAMQKAINHSPAKDHVQTESKTEMTKQKRQRNVLRGTFSTDDDGSEEDSAYHSYTSVPINRRIRKMMMNMTKSNARKDKVKRRRKGSDRKMEEEDSCSSDTDTGENGDGENKRNKQGNALSDKIVQMNEGIKQIVSMLTPPTPKANDSQEQAAQKETSATNGTLDQRQPLDKQDGASDVKGSGLLDNTHRTSVDELFS